MSIQVTESNPGGQCFVDLSTQFRFHIRGARFADHVFFSSRQVAVGIDKGWDLVLSCDWSPAVATELRIQYQVNPKILLRMLPGPFSKLRKPGAWNHDAAR